MTDPSTPPQSPVSANDTSGFFSALFDMNFKTFIALKFIKVIYLIALVLIGLGAIVTFFSTIGDQPFVALASLVFLFLYLIFIRVWLEVIALLFRIGEDTKAIREGITKGS